MNKQPEALRLADLFEFESDQDSLYRKAAAEFRRLHAENQALNDALQYSMGCHREMSDLAIRQRARLDEVERDQKQDYREPLTDMQKMMCWSRATHDADVWHKTDHQCLMDYGSEIESAHNIK